MSASSNMASIFKAADRETAKDIAVKIPLMALENDVAGYERFRREEETYGTSSRKLGR
jgi:hypothetical protein